MPDKPANGRRKSRADEEAVLKGASARKMIPDFTYKVAVIGGIRPAILRAASSRHEWGQDNSF